MAAFDLDASRAARAEAEREPHEVTFGGEVFVFPPEVPLETLDLMADGRFRDAFRVLLDDDEDVAGRFFRHRPTERDLKDLMGGVYGYGDFPESSASARSSLSTGRRSRPTSKPSTASTSRPAAGARSG